MPEASLWLQTVTLLKRNLRIKMRMKGPTIQEILLPIYFVVLLALLKTFAYKPIAYQPLTNASTTSLATTFQLPNATFYVAPNFAEAVTLMDTLMSIGILPGVPNYQMFDSLTEMDDAYKNASSDIRDKIFGIYFPTSSVESYALRFKYNSVSNSFTDFPQGNCRSEGHGLDRFACPANQFLFSGFAALQAAVDTAIARQTSSTYAPMDISARIMPKDATLANTEVFGLLAPLYFVWALSPFMTFLLVNIVYEKEKKIKEGMKMMGLDDLAYWFSWGIIYAALLAVMTLVMTIISVFGNLFPLSNFFLIFLLMFLYGLSIEMMSYMITPFFTKARTAGGLGSMLSIIIALLFLPIALVPEFPVYGIWLLSLFSPVAFAFVIKKITYFEVAGVGAHFYNLTQDDDAIYIGLVMIVVDIFLYFFLTLYLDSVVPGEYGRKKSPLFCFKPSYWFKSRRGTKSRSSFRSRSVRSNSSYAPPVQDIEDIPQEFAGQEAIRLHNVTKVYRKNPIFNDNVTETVAVKNFTMDIYKGQITALLGHNGAGKTTLFNILTGFVSSTSGTTTVYDYDIEDSDDMSEIRKMTGVCPQHDILHMVLSVLDHLEVFAGIKGYVGEEKDTEVNRVLHVVGLVDQKDTLAKHLSGGQKRKLSVGIAILGDPKILILDEPTAGMDPYSRRKLWNLLRTQQEDRVTILTTHFMDEADILADRKAIISKGKLRCAGSSLFLKNRFGVGYHLGIVTKEHEDEQAVSSCVMRHIVDAKLQRSVGMEHSYILPLSQVSNFGELFGDLDTQQDKLNVQSYGISMTTMEEVFLKIGNEEDEMDEANGRIDNTPIVEPDNGNVGYANPAATVPGETSDPETVVLNVNGTRATFDPAKSQSSAPASSIDVILAMLRRTLLINIRSPGYVFFSILLPIIVSIGGFFVMAIQPASDSDDPNLIDVTYKNNLGSYLSKSVLYENSTGSSLENFIINFQSGLTAESVNLSDPTVLLKSGFYPHFVGLDIDNFTSSNCKYTAVYNTSYIRSLPSAINVFTNSLVSFLRGSEANIETFSKQWPKTDSSTTFNAGAVGGVLLVAMSFVLTTSFAAIYPVKERETKIRGQLRVSGVRFVNYWLPWLLHDYIVCFILIIVFIICIFAINVPSLNNAGAISAAVILFIGWGVSCILASYCGSFLFSKFETASSAWPGLVQIGSILPYILVSTLDQTMVGSDVDIYVNIVFVIIDPYYVGFSGIYYILKVYIDRLITQQSVTDVPASIYYDWSNPMVPLAILMVYIHIVFFAFLLVIADVKKHGGELPFSGIFRRKQAVGSSADLQPASNPDYIEGEDDDVAKERLKVMEISDSQSYQGEEGPLVVVDSLRKEFTKRTEKKCQSCRKPNIEEGEETIKVAVRNLSMTVYPGEVVGLLGPNGAGKTTALNVLIADLAASRGKVSVAGHSVASTFSDAFKEMGYCPQSNPLWDELSLREHLEVYAAIRGVKKDKIASTVDNFIDALDVGEHAIKRAKTLSGGTKRKLCFAIAMLGNPQVVLLDEPSTGMDPKTKRFMWNTISSAFEGSNRGAILTTHYMEEADALCTRVGIMVLGHLKCIGSTQHLKGKFGQGYILEVKLESDPVQEDDDDDEDPGDNPGEKFVELDNFLKEVFPNMEEPERFGTRVTYKIKKDDVVSLAKVFSSLEEAKERLRIEEYSFSQSTLEQVFLRFAKEQEEKDEEEQHRIEELKKARRRMKKKSAC